MSLTNENWLCCYLNAAVVIVVNTTWLAAFTAFRRGPIPDPGDKLAPGNPDPVQDALEVAKDVLNFIAYMSKWSQVAPIARHLKIVRGETRTSRKF